MGYHAVKCCKPEPVIHEMGQLGAGQTRADFIGIDNAFLHLVQHINGLLHILIVAKGHGSGVVDHHECGGSHQHRGTGHGDHGGCGCRQPIDFHRDLALVIHEHGINLACGNTVSTGGIDPDGDVPGTGIQFIPEHLGGHIVIEPGFLGDGAVEFKDPLGCFAVCLIFPRPELLVLHWVPPFLS